MIKEFVAKREKIKAIQEEIDFWRARSTLPTGSTTQINYDPNFHTESMQALCVEKVSELEDTLARERAEYERLYDKVLSTIMRLDNMDYKKFLVAKYIDNMPWDEIVKLMYYSERYLFKFQKKAIAALEALF